MNDIILYDYWRSSASYRVRIALNLAGLDYRKVSVNLLEKEHKSDAHLVRHPRGLVPVLEIDGHSFTQSLAIIDYLDNTRELGLLPADPVKRAKVQALAHTLAVDVHPVCNISVVTYVAGLNNGDAEQRKTWMKHFIRPGLVAFEALLTELQPAPYANGDNPGLAEICLIPQLYNADRWGADYSDCPQIKLLNSICAEQPAFMKAFPSSEQSG